MGKLTDLRRAKTLIVNLGDHVNYRGVDWFYIPQMEGSVLRAVQLLERNRKLVRWSKQTPDLVRFK